MRPGVRPPRGFTLLESLVAGGIFFIAVVAISLISVRGATNASLGLRYAQTARLATQEMEKWSMLGYTGLQTATGGVTPWSPAGYPIAQQPDGGGKQYNVTITVVNAAGPPGPPRGRFRRPSWGRAGPQSLPTSSASRSPPRRPRRSKSPHVGPAASVSPN